ncbi:magnesium transporter MgtC [Oceanicola sp. 22II-s10i]|uniref:MgtC/SapB family protein n=1 Tax=Oceanicola sp. 22II-s10i TaxID=1317116 RepID=UPI000B527ECD|nr:MgtC/SapB family protein [Oceanicola sp. 22II-s10i]OWU85220.1 magnesium transporter MgtC [Oceanicola sp. 22II-s10i]
MTGFFEEFLASPVPGLNWLHVTLRLAIAILLGGLLGWEREAVRKEAGLRTHMMISLAACLFALITLGLMASPLADDDSIRKDPIRVIEAVTAGVAFLAAGTIFTRGGDVKGLTTGAGMWLAGAIGVATGLGNIGLACLATLLALTVLRLFKLLERRAERHED